MNTKADSGQIPSERTLTDLEGEDYGPPSADATSLVKSVLLLRKQPLGQLRASDLRLLIGQDQGLPWLVPLALRLLAQNPLLEADFYEGDLLLSLLHISPAFYRDYPLLREETEQVLALLPLTLEILEARGRPLLERRTQELDWSVERFRRSA